MNSRRLKGGERNAHRVPCAGWARSSNGWPVLAAACALAAALGGMPARAEPLAVDQPRSIGHVIGDVLTQRVPLGSAALPALAALPPAGRVGLWLERRAPRVERDTAGRPWLVVEYQVINAPPLPTRAALPALKIAVGQSAPALAVPAWPIGIGPITPPDLWAAGPLAALRPDRGVAPADTAPLLRQWQLSLAVLAAALLAWGGWWQWRNRRDRERPFARAVRGLARLDEADPAAWRALHRAIDATAGRVVPRSGVAQLLSHRPQLRPLSGALDSFFAQSSARFFGPADRTPDAAALRPLARALRDAERLHARGDVR